MFDKLSKDIYALTQEHAGNRTARATFWMALTAGWCVGLGIIIGAVVVVTKFLLAYVSLIPRLPLPQLGSVALSLAIAIAVVAVAGAWLLKTFRRMRDVVIRVFAERLDALDTEVRTVSGRISDVAGLVGTNADRLHHLESNAARSVSE
jgi:hypothetical protein